MSGEAWDLSAGQPAKDVATLALAATGGAILAKMVKGGGPVLLLSPHIVETLLAVADDIGPAVDRLAQTTGLDRAPELEETFEELRRLL